MKYTNKTRSVFPHSHFDIVLSLIPNNSDNCFYVYHFAFLASEINFPIFTWSIVFLLSDHRIVYKIDILHPRNVENGEYMRILRFVDYKISTEQTSSNNFISTSLRIASNSCRIHVNNFMLEIAYNNGCPVLINNTWWVNNDIEQQSIAKAWN